jgi:hypothetical protein
VVESTALEMRRALTGTVGSNPTLSARVRVAIVMPGHSRPAAGAVPIPDLPILLLSAASRARAASYPIALRLPVLPS